MPKTPVVHITRVPVTIPLTSGMMPLTVALGVEQIQYVLCWHALQKKSWRLGNTLRQWGIRYITGPPSSVTRPTPTSFMI
jgi:hypothetical protein